MEVKRHLFLTSTLSRSSWLDRIWWWLLVVSAAFAAFVVAAPDAFSAVPAVRVDERYKWLDQFGQTGYSIDQKCTSVAGALLPAWEITNPNRFTAPYTRGVATESSGVCSAFEVVQSGTVQWTENITWLQAPVAANTIDDFSNQEIAVLVGSMLCFGLGWISGQQR